MAVRYRLNALALTLQASFQVCVWDALAQGINRLGKGPPKPGTFRPPDPNKFRTIDMYAEGTEGDIDYQRMVSDVSDCLKDRGYA